MVTVCEFIDMIIFQIILKRWQKVFVKQNMMSSYVGKRVSWMVNDFMQHILVKVWKQCAYKK